MSNPAPPFGDNKTPDPLEYDKWEYEKKKDEEKRAEEERQRQARAEARKNAVAGARARASRYLQDQGLDPTQYGSYISDAINEIMGTVSPEDDAPGQYLKDVEQSVYDTLTNRSRSQANSLLDQLFGQDYERRKISDTLDDSQIAAIEAEQRNQAEQIINNMLARGVIKDTGRTAAEKELDRQSAGVRAQLNSIGTDVLSQGRQSIADIINRARTTASTIKPSQQFTADQYTSDVNSAFDDFLSNLGTNIRAKVTAPLFDTSALAAIAGGGQGAQNLRYDPRAARGIVDNPDDPNADRNRFTFKQGGGTIF